MKIYDFVVKNAKGETVSLKQYEGKVLLIVNVASECGFTPQYEGLQNLYSDLAEKGLVVLGFPCNQFGGQEPGTEEEIQGFCTGRFGVKFPIMAKIDVNGEDADTLYEFLKDEAPGLLGTKAIKWNFTKFLIDRSGKVVKRFAPQDKPEAIRAEIEALL